MAWTATTLDQIEDAIATAAIRGFVEANFGDTGFRRYTVAELLELRKAVKEALAAASPVSGTGSSGTRCTYGSFKKG